MSLTRESPIKDLFNAWLDFYRPGLKPNTINHYDFSIRQFMGIVGETKPIGEITRNEVNEYCTKLLAIHTGNYTRGRLKVVWRMFRWAADDGLVVNPVQFRRLIQIPKERIDRPPVTWDQYNRIMNVLEVGQFKDYWPAACTIGFFTGLRIGDIACLRWEVDEHGRGSRVSFDDELIVVWPMKLSHMRQRLEIPMEIELYEMLLAIKNANRFPTSPYVMPMMHGRYLTPGRELRREFRKICDTAGLHEHSFHCFRHGFVTRLINAGVDPLTIKSMTGQNLQQIQEYAHISTKAKFNALAASRNAMLRERAERSSRPVPGVVQL
jgi:integrase